MKRKLNAMYRYLLNQGFLSKPKLDFEYDLGNFFFQIMSVWSNIDENPMEATENNKILKSAKGAITQNKADN